MKLETEENPSSYEIKSLSSVNVEKIMFQLLASIPKDIEKTFGSGGKVIIAMSQQSAGKNLLRLYQREWGVTKWTAESLGKAFIDLENRLGGDSRLVSFSDNEIVLEMNKCLFGNDNVRTSDGALCSIIPSLFGAMAQAAGLANRITLADVPTSIAAGDDHCTVVIKLNNK